MSCRALADDDPAVDLAQQQSPRAIPDLSARYVHVPYRNPYPRRGPRSPLIRTGVSVGKNYAGEG